MIEDNLKNNNRSDSIKKVDEKEIKQLLDNVSKVKQIDEEIKKLEDEYDELVNQRGKGLEILTLQQMLIKLPTFLAKLQAGNNSKKLKNEIKQLLNSLDELKKEVNWCMKN